MSNQNKRKAGIREQGSEDRVHSSGRTLSVLCGLGGESGDSERRFAALVVADADGVEHRADKDLAVADAPRACGPDDGLDGLFLQLVGDHHFDLYLGQKINSVFAAAVELGVALLAAVAARFQDR